MGMMGFVKAGEKMTDKLVNTFDLGAFSDEEKDLLRTDLSYKKRMSKINKREKPLSEIHAMFVANTLRVFVTLILFHAFALKTLQAKARC